MSEQTIRHSSVYVRQNSPGWVADLFSESRPNSSIAAFEKLWSKNNSISIQRKMITQTSSMVISIGGRTCALRSRADTSPKLPIRDVERYTEYRFFFALVCLALGLVVADVIFTPERVRSGMDSGESWFVGP